MGEEFEWLEDVSIVSSSVPIDIIMPTATDRLPAIIRDELRRVVAVRSMDILFKKTSMKVSEQRQLMYDMFHGNVRKSIIAGVHQLCAAQDVYSDMFEDRTDQVLSRATEDRPSKQLETMCSRSEKT